MWPSIGWPVPPVAGLAGAIFDWCQKSSPNIRIDTHHDNRVMQHPDQHGFTYCGLIYLKSGAERLAYQRVVKVADHVIVLDDSRKERFYEKNSIDDGPDGVFVAGVRLRERSRKGFLQSAYCVDNFNVIWQLTVINCIEGDVLFQMTGKMSITADTADNQLEVIVEDEDGSYKKHYIGLSDNVTYVLEDLGENNVSK